MIEAVLTPAMFRNRAYDCQSLAERAPNQRVRDILLDMSRTWTRLALEAEEWRRDNSPRSRLAKKDARFTAAASGFLNFNQSGERPVR